MPMEDFLRTPSNAYVGRDQVIGPLQPRSYVANAHRTRPSLQCRRIGAIDRREGEEDPSGVLREQEVDNDALYGHLRLDHEIRILEGMRAHPKGRVVSIARFSRL